MFTSGVALAQSEAPPPPSYDTGTVSLLAGMAVPVHGLHYGAGFGVRAGVNLGHFYLGGTFAVHAGDEKTIRYGRISSLGVDAGAQRYSSLPMFVTADAGYNITIPIGGLDARIGALSEDDDLHRSGGGLGLRA